MLSALHVLQITIDEIGWLFYGTNLLFMSMNLVEEKMLQCEAFVDVSTTKQAIITKSLGLTQTTTRQSASKDKSRSTASEHWPPKSNLNYNKHPQNTLRSLCCRAFA